MASGDDYSGGAQVDEMNCGCETETTIASCDEDGLVFEGAGWRERGEVEFVVVDYFGYSQHFDGWRGRIERCERV